MACCSLPCASHGGGTCKSKDDDWVFVDSSPDRYVRIRPAECSVIIPPLRISNTNQPFKVSCHMKDPGCSTSSLLKSCLSQGCRVYPSRTGSCGGNTSSTSHGTQLGIQPPGCEVTFPGGCLYSNMHKGKVSLSTSPDSRPC